MRAFTLAGWIAMLAVPLVAQDDPTVPDKHLERYFGKKPDTFLVDPQGLLSGEQRREREQFLAYHSKDSEIDFQVLLFGEGQQVPGDVRVEELGERFYDDGKPCLLALYFLGEPERVRLILSPQIADVVSVAELARLRQQAVRAAEARTVAEEQLEDFCIQLAIGIFWIEREAGLGGGPDTAGPGEENPVVPPESKDRPAMAKRWKAWAAEWGVPAGVIGGGVLAAILLRWILRRRARHRFPDRLPTPRLGGEHGAGIGALIEFRSSTRSPTHQKGEPDDSLGGL